MDIFRCSSTTNVSEKSESVELSNVGLSIHDLLRAAHVRLGAGLLTFAQNLWQVQAGESARTFNASKS